MSTLKDNSTTLPDNIISGTCSLPKNALSGAAITGLANQAIRSGGSLIGTNNGIGGGNSLLEPISSRLTAIEERLAILTPDLQKLEKYSALKQAYENYKLIETLCKEQT